MAILSKKEKLEILQRALKRETEKVTEKVREESLNEGRQEVARSMVRDGSIPLSKIAEYSGLSINEVESIRNSLQI